MSEVGFRCPICGAVTRVTETRRIPGGVRRRRVCSTRVCDMKITTAELTVGQNWTDGTRTGGPVVALRLRDVQTIASIVNTGLGMNPDTDAAADDEEGNNVAH